MKNFFQLWDPQVANGKNIFKIVFNLNAVVGKWNSMQRKKADKKNEGM